MYTTPERLDLTRLSPPTTKQPSKVQHLKGIFFQRCSLRTATRFPSSLASRHWLRPVFRLYNTDARANMDDSMMDDSVFDDGGSSDFEPVKAVSPDSAPFVASLTRLLRNPKSSRRRSRRLSRRPRRRSSHSPLSKRQKPRPRSAQSRSRMTKRT